MLSCFSVVKFPPGRIVKFLINEKSLDKNKKRSYNNYRK
uniref:Uncharacterized protein n=1 Tax=Siphoviridae sp. ct2vX3 TaxID=2825318 RepID=A0A8S5PYD1_9CAUD|nr:MAG TPA: hypothetical protein [Siphoviridae sp. ct2vX3]